MDGREIVYKIIKKKAIKALIIKILICVLPLLCAIFMAVEEKSPIYLVIYGPFTVLLILPDIINLIKPEMNRKVRKDPEIFNKAEEHYDNIVIEYKALKIKVSRKYLTYKDNIDFIPLEEINNLYIKKTRVYTNNNYRGTDNYMCIDHSRGKINILISVSDLEDVQKFIAMLTPMVP